LADHQVMTDGEGEVEGASTPLCCNYWLFFDEIWHWRLMLEG
jgi:hypothetical protein